MRLAIILCLMLSVATASSCRDQYVDKKITRCWMRVSRVQGYATIKNVEFVYLRGEAIVFPSSECDNLRMQAVNIKNDSLYKIRSMEKRGDYNGLTGRATVEFDVVGMPSENVIEINISNIFNIKMIKGSLSEDIVARLKK